MSIDWDDSLQKSNSPQAKKTNQWNPFHAKRVIIVILVIVILLMFLAALKPLYCGLIPPTKYAGTQLYETGKYLEFDKGTLFGEYVSQLPFAKEAKVVNFAYYDFWLRDAIFKEDPFPDIYLVQLAPAVSYDSVKQYLDAHYSNESVLKDDDHSIYYLGDGVGADNFYVSVNDQRQEVFCFLVTDHSAWAGVDGIFAQNLGWVPGE